MAMVAACAGHRVVSVDIDGNVLREAAARVRQCGDAVADNIEFLEANAICLPFDDEQFDGVLSFEAIHHLPDCRVALTEMCRVTRSRGAIVIADLNERGLRAVRETTLAIQGESHEENSCRLPEIEAIVAECAVVERHDLEFISVFIVRK
jgi:ubiquinone/menaquinone biosynthesis C-methylase UbiE